MSQAASRNIVLLIIATIVFDSLCKVETASPYFTSNFKEDQRRNADSSKKSTEDTKISHYTDENGVKVEKDSVEAVVLHSESGPMIANDNSQSEEEDPYSQYDHWINSEDYSKEDSYRNQYTGTTLRTSQMTDNTNEEDEIYDDEEPETGQTQQGSFFDSASNVFSVYSSLLTAWESVRKHREELARQQNQTRIQAQKEEEDRSRRNPFNSTRDFSYSDITTRTTEEPLTSSSTRVAVAEGRYIKGDPLKGYYDFVITEGSYKFWAAFQLATAALVIYSTFAAIYYSKVNPIVSDYDYVDYLGGGRSLSNADTSDYPDPSSIEEPSDHNDTKEYSPSIWSSVGNWIPKFGHTAKFVLEAIDKIPQ